MGSFFTRGRSFDSEVTPSTQLYKKKASDANHVKYQPNKSSTWKSMAGASWNITYGDGTGASGSVGTDLLRIGDITIKNQAIEAKIIVSALSAINLQDHHSLPLKCQSE